MKFWLQILLNSSFNTIKDCSYCVIIIIVTLFFFIIISIILDIKLYNLKPYSELIFNYKGLYD